MEVVGADERSRSAEAAVSSSGHGKFSIDFVNPQEKGRVDSKHLKKLSFFVFVCFLSL